MPHPYQIWDVFTETPLAGNPLAVVFDAQDLAAERMQAIAREFNLSETIFVLPPADPANTGAARIFTPFTELPFAGHPTVGGAVAVARRRGRGEAGIALELPAGLARCTVTHTAPAAAEVAAPRRPTLEPGTPDRAALAAALGLPEAAIGGGGLDPARACSGPNFTIVPVDTVDRLGAVRPDRAVWRAAFGDGWTMAYVIARGGAGDFQCRMFAPLDGIDEDPATGSAAVAFAALFARSGGAGEGTHRLTIAQGIEMGRPSSVRLTVEAAGGEAVRVRLAGRAVPVAEGTLLL